MDYTSEELSDLSKKELWDLVKALELTDMKWTMPVDAFRVAILDAQSKAQVAAAVAVVDEVKVVTKAVEPGHGDKVCVNCANFLRSGCRYGYPKFDRVEDAAGGIYDAAKGTCLAFRKGPPEY